MSAVQICCAGPLRITKGESLREGTFGWRRGTILNSKKLRAILTVQEGGKAGAVGLGEGQVVRPGSEKSGKKGSELNEYLFMILGTVAGYGMRRPRVDYSLRSETENGE